MTIDESGNIVQAEPAILYTVGNNGELAPVTDRTPSLLENPDMLKSTFATIANSLVEASDLAREVKELRAAIERLQNAIDVANDQAAVAIRERDAALSSRDAALRREEIANAAFETVNHQRLDAEQEAHQLRQDRTRLQDENAALNSDVVNAAARIADLEVHIARLNVDYEAETTNLREETNRALDKARDFEDLYNVALQDTKRLETERDEVKSVLKSLTHDYDTAIWERNSARTSLAEIRAIVG